MSISNVETIAATAELPFNYVMQKILTRSKRLGISPDRVSDVLVAFVLHGDRFDIALETTIEKLLKGEHPEAILRSIYEAVK